MNTDKLLQEAKHFLNESSTKAEKVLLGYGFSKGMSDMEAKMYQLVTTEPESVIQSVSKDLVRLRYVLTDKARNHVALDANGNDGDATIVNMSVTPDFRDKLPKISATVFFT